MGTDVVLAAFPREDFFVAAFLAARRLRLPFYAHMHDLWQENMPAGARRPFCGYLGTCHPATGHARPVYDGGHAKTLREEVWHSD